MDDQSHQVYRFYDERGRLLYVGQAKCSILRAYTHRSKAPWFHRVDSWTIQYVASKEEALRIEAETIWADEPMFNIDGQKHGIQEIARKRLAKEKAEKHPLLESVPIPSAHGVSPSTIDMERLDLRRERNAFYAECEALTRSRNEVVELAQMLDVALNDLLKADVNVRRRALRFMHGGQEAS